MSSSNSPVCLGFISCSLTQLTPAAIALGSSNQTYWVCVLHSKKRVFVYLDNSTHYLGCFPPALSSALIPLLGKCNYLSHPGPAGGWTSSSVLSSADSPQCFLEVGLEINVGPSTTFQLAILVFVIPAKKKQLLASLHNHNIPINTPQNYDPANHGGCPLFSLENTAAPPTFEYSAAVGKVLLTLPSGEDLDPAQPHPIVTTELLPLQKQGLAFLLDRESPNSISACALWIKSPGSTSQNLIWRHVITAEEHLTSNGLPPPSPLGSLLADDMGLGKSLQTISLIASTLTEALEFGLDDHSATKLQATLVICPANLIDNWKAEILKHTYPTSLDILIYHGRYRHNIPPHELRGSHVIITSYQIVSSEWRSKISGNSSYASPLFPESWFRVVLDEAQ